MDQVLLTVVTAHSYFTISMERRRASDAIREWYEHRANVSSQKEGWELSDRALKYGTLNVVADAKFYTHAIGLEHVIGIYIQEIAPTTQDRLVTALEKSVRDSSGGEEWKQG